MPRTYVKRMDAAELVGAFLWEHRDDTVTMDEIMHETGLSYQQVAGAEQALKQLVARNIEKFGGYTLYIALGITGEHGFIRESEKTMADQMARARYMVTRAASEVAYVSQAADRVLDADDSRRLQRALTQYEGAKAALENAMEFIEAHLVAG